jgi:hypothetical protein
MLDFSHALLRVLFVYKHSLLLNHCMLLNADKCWMRWLPAAAPCYRAETP